jgi:hypothetical protein
MKNEYKGMQKIRLALEQGASNLDLTITTRLARARNNALAHQKHAAAELSLAGIGASMGDILPHRARMLIAIAALTLGVVGTYYWNTFEQADENVEIDSALLADDLPIDAYTDHGFRAWLEHSSQSSPQ